MQFHKTTYPCLHRVKWEVQNTEQTQELRLNDGMPDIGRVLGSWGQVLLRSKEWRNGEMTVSGGVMVWVLYAPEDGSDPRCMESWIPFQQSWELPETQYDGNINAVCLLRYVDARSISARKMMVRVGVGCLGEAMVQSEVGVYNPDDMPEDVQLLRNTYPMMLPKEAGEKPFVIDDELSGPAPQKVIYYTLQPEIMDQRVMAGKVVFRGAAKLHMLCRGEDGILYTRDHEIPFSQFSELDGEYSADADACVTPAVTSLELEILPEGQLHLKAGLTGQYVISDREMVEVVEDAYSPRRPVEMQWEQLILPAELDRQRQTVRVETSVPTQGGRVVDTVFYPDNARTMRFDDQAEIALAGQFQMLFYDPEEHLQSVQPRWEGEWTLPADKDSQVLVTVENTGLAQGSMSGETAQLQSEIPVSALTVAQKGIGMVTGLELGEETQQERPNLILRKAGDDSLWELAKRCGSTVEAITKANSLEDQPEKDRILLIPVV
ncbi:MAG: DUF3794 domain-containing protein [Oscillospiraceae bacterium]|nr:DUF3794 domain-containing protein [Oscillospiraceae bacterium]